MVDIVIVNWNSGKLLKKCIDSLQLPGNDSLVSSIFIIDNHSVDASMTGLESIPKIRIIQNATNLGFAKACNQGFKLCSAPFVLLLNPDTQLLENTIADCYQFAQLHKGIDILGCQLLNDEGAISPSCARFPTASGMLLDATGLPRIAPSIFKPSILMTDWNHRQSRFVDQVMGAFMFIRRNLFDELGYFDEQFFVYYEELDFSFRLAKAGGKTYYNAEIKALHSGMGTTESVKAFRLALNLKSRLRYAKKHFSYLGYLLVYFCTFTLEFISRAFFLLVSGRSNEIKDLLKGYGLLLKTDLPGGNTTAISTLSRQ